MQQRHHFFGNGQNGLLYISNLNTKTNMENIKTNMEVDGNVHIMPLDKQHYENSECWCNPEIIDDFTSNGGKKVYLHREIQ